jgi:subtilisin-like proprotein convertase family protein
MKKLFFIFALLIGAITDLSSQVIYSSKIDSIINLVSMQSISRMNKELSGDTTVLVSGVNRKNYSRYYLSPDNVRAARYIYEKFLSYGLTPKYMINNISNNNVYAVKTGTKYPDKKVIIGAHYDDITWPTLPGIYDTIHGADDNASGVCAVLESARLLANMDMDYTVIFVAFDEEEMGLYGSMAFADSCLARNENIVGVINLDMIGYDANNDSKSRIMTDTNSQMFYNIFSQVVQKYNIGLYPIKALSTGGGSDHYYFWVNGYKAITSIEDDFNAYYHTVNETFDKFNVPYFHKMVKAAVGFLMTLATDKYLNIEMNHNPLASTYETGSRVAVLKLYSDVKIANGSNAPRLYYKIGNGAYSFTNSFYQRNDTLLFLIPAYPVGTRVSYYFALQNSRAECVCTLPFGGDGISPPGTTPPASVYEYDILNNNGYCSSTVPKEIKDNQITSDTIHISEKGILKSITLTLNLNHTNDGDLIIVLSTPTAGSITLASSAGEGGQNFTNTIFDDTSSVSITLGTPPFTGRFKPAGSFAVLKNKDFSGDWVLKILDKKTGDVGTLLGWCMQITYTTVGVNEISSTLPKEYKLFQNYPNPFNPTTNIKYQISNNGLVSLKVYDILGKEVETIVNEYQNAGIYEVQFQGSSLPSGVYLYKLTAGDYTSVKRMVLVK